MSEFRLLPHPDTPPSGVEGVHVMVERNGDVLLLTFVVDGNEHVALPEWTTSARVDGLWKTTCCELFLAAADTDSYVEFNYSPSTCWAAYRFDAYRAGMTELSVTAPRVDRGDDDSDYLVTIEQNLSDLPFVPTRMGLSAVIEETDGTRSYWALAHVPGSPDFHDRGCFTASLPPPLR